LSPDDVSKTLQAWIDARKRHRLSDAHVQMARELGLNPITLGKLDNHRHESWKAPLPQFIEACYMKRFGEARPEVVMPVKTRFRLEEAKRAARRAAKRIAQNSQSESATVSLRGEADDPAR
jgi:hypothetical protein